MGFKPFYGKSEIKIANENMEKLGISHLSNSCYRELSGGQQQRVLLARALCATKKMLLLDEPVTGLDPKSSMEMYDVVKNLNKQDKITIVMVSHDIKTAIKNASHILHVSYEPLFFGKKEDYLKSDIGKSFFCNTGGNSND
ncbi:Vitamin B12 import ATP-binding protein BtuD [bioreactor metagenome]|uniref:Vitamin B12 import ATP-binding protein BtuD n=1 Tax=bioreactor metagenome TaxID=1076179 RepID=A0A645IQV5_9ZZZZ